MKPEDFQGELVSGNVKAAMQEAGATSRDLWYVPFDKLRVIDGFNVRTKDESYDQHVRGLADSIKENGYYVDKPMAGYVVSEGGHEVIVITDGHCRYAACELAITEGAPLDKIPVAVKPRTTSMADLTVALVTSNSGKPLTPYEIGLVCKRLESFGWTPDEMAKRLSFSRSYVDQLLLLMASPEKLQKLVTSGTVSARNAVDAVKKHGAGAADVIQKAAEGTNGKVTKKHLEPSDKFSRAVKKEAVEAYDLLQAVAEDPAYMKLDKDLRLKMLALFDKIPRRA